jgi:chromosome segregation ATPase
METIFRWLARMLAGILERYADPDLDAKLKAHNEKTAEVDAAHKRLEEAEAALALKAAESAKHNAELQAKIDEINSAIDNKEVVLAELRRQNEEIDAAAQQAKAEIDSKTDKEKVRLDL